MKTILFVNCCISCGIRSRTRALAEAYLSKALRLSPDAVVEEEDLVNRPYAPLTKTVLLERSGLVTARSIGSDMYMPAQRFKQADEIVIAAPYWDLSFPAELKAYIENIMVNTVTFTYENDRPKGLCRAKRITYITTAGGYIENADFGFGYIGAIGKMLGINECVRIYAEGLDIEGCDAGAVLAAAIKGVLDDGN